jgi:hypothetical protein
MGGAGLEHGPRLADLAISETVRPQFDRLGMATTRSISASLLDQTHSAEERA